MADIAEVQCTSGLSLATSETRCFMTPLQVFRDRHGMMGVVDYASKDDMKYALRKLDDSEFKVLLLPSLSATCSLMTCVAAAPCCRASSVVQAVEALLLRGSTL